MFRLLAAICLTGVAGLLLVGGCTPESENSWSENLDFGDIDPRLADMSGTYSMSTNIDDRFTSLTIYQTSGSLQGYDNMRRSWRGSIAGSQPPGAGGFAAWPQLQLQTNDGPEGQVILTGTGNIFVDMFGNCYQGIEGSIYSGEMSGTFSGWGPVIPCVLTQ